MGDRHFNISAIDAGLPSFVLSFRAIQCLKLSKLRNDRNPLIPASGLGVFSSRLARYLALSIPLGEISRLGELGKLPKYELAVVETALGLSSATFNRITRLDLHFHPYQMIRRHRLLPGDLSRRFRFCQWFLDKNAHFLEDLIIVDRSGFALNASVNTYNI